MVKQNIHTMKQPELGKRISELRKEKGLTQEELVEQCNINVRTIQRIEAGEVNPRTYTIKTILNVLGEDFTDKLMVKEDLKNHSFTLKEQKRLELSWISGIVLVILSSIVIVHSYMTRTSNWSDAITTIVLLLIVSLFFYLRGYKVLAVKFSNYLLKMSVYFGFFLLVLIFIGGKMGIDYLKFIGFFIGVTEILKGVGIYRLNSEFGERAKTIGVLKIIIGAFLILSTLNRVLLIPTFALIIFALIYQVIFIYKIFMKSKSTHDDTAHSLE